MGNKCVSCGSGATRNTISLGLNPPSNRYIKTIDENSELHPLEFGYCENCGLAQLMNPMPPASVRSHFDWITYNEPEGHLDSLVDVIISRTDSKVLSGHVTALTYKDDSTLRRLIEKGSASAYRVSQYEDLGMKGALASLETLQELFTLNAAESIIERTGQADVLLARHVLEHAHQPRQLIETCHAITKPAGVMVFEVPDCTKIITGHDHCFIWEEHISYFTPATLRALFNHAGFLEIEILVYPYLLEDSLIAIVGNIRSEQTVSVVNADKEITRLNEFADSLRPRGQRIRQHLKMFQEHGKSVALFGAGHLAAKFINFYDLADCLVGVIDENPNKIGLFMPGSKVPIIYSSSMDSGSTDICLLALKAESERVVLDTRKDYISNGGKFLSIFSSSPISIDKDIINDPTSRD